MNSLPNRLAGNDADRQHDGGDGDGGLLPAHHPGDDRPVDADQEAIDRVLGFRADLAANEEQHQHRHQRHRQQRGSSH
jgi:hypothetical protein